MRHLFVIQCCKYAQAVALGKLLKDISPEEDGFPKWDIFYAYDIYSNDRKLFETLPNAHGFKIGYCTIDQGMFHLLLWRYLSHHEEYNFDYYHLISESDFPFKGIYRIDDLVRGYDFYGYIQLIKMMSKSIAWYGLSKTACDMVSRWILEISRKVPDIWYNHETFSGYTGGIDEYIISAMMEYLVTELGMRRRNECLRLVMYQEQGKDATLATDGTPIDWYGHKSRSKTSPIILDDTPATNYAFENWDVLFGRKFDFDSNSYEHFYKLIYETRV